MSIAFICSVVALFGVLLWESAPGTERASLHPAGLLRWAISGNWLAKVGALIVSIGAGALLRYFMLALTFPPAGKLMAGVASSAGLAIASAVLMAHAGRRATSLALAGAALAVAYLTAYTCRSTTRKCCRCCSRWWQYTWRCRCSKLTAPRHVRGHGASIKPIFCSSRSLLRSSA